ncbi:hypothetical protein LCGC14_2263790 [marine sediment metagenome]|uniref:OB domain-containing protein n=1 Tax=marine sediment metagenome TaxID=412755 RepID=A0A0F9CYV8_9ZZZZ
MNNLNSVLIEGTVENISPISDKQIAFTIRSKRTVRVEEELTEIECIFKVRTSELLKKSCRDYLKPGRTVRIVGRLARDGAEVYISAEHIELRP